MRSILLTSVLAAACGMWTGCANTQIGSNSFTDSKTHFQNAFTDSKGKFRPDWAAGINCPTSYPRALAMVGDDVYSISGMFNGENARLDAKFDGKMPLVNDDTVVVSNEPNEPIVPENTPAVRDNEAIRLQQEKAEEARTARQPDVSDGRYGITGDTLEPAPLTLRQMQRIYVDDKGKFRPDWAGGINTPPYIQQRALGHQ